jgi:hypothetical protein
MTVQEEKRGGAVRWQNSGQFWGFCVLNQGEMIDTRDDSRLS